MNRKSTQIVAVVFALVALCTLPQESVAQDAAFAPVEFMVGQWVGQGDGVFIEEVWSAPSGDNMMGMFRYVRSGTGSFYEMMLIEQVEKALVLRIKHFNAGLIGWEEKAEVHSFTLTESAENRGLFVQADGAKRLRYVRTGNQLDVALEELEGDEWKSQSFRFEKAK